MKREKEGTGISFGDKLEALLKRKEEEDEATCLMKNVVAAQHKKSFEAEQCLCNALREYVDNYGRDHFRAKTLMTKCWQSVQGRSTKNMNLEKNLEDIQSTARRVGGNEEDKTRRLWAQDEGDEQKAPQPACLCPRRREKRSMKSSCLIRTIRCGTKWQKNGSNT